MKLINNFRNLLALLIAVIVFPAIWVMQGLKILNLPGEVVGMSIAIETLIAQFYWRKKGQDETASKS